MDIQGNNLKNLKNKYKYNLIMCVSSNEVLNNRDLEKAIIQTYKIFNIEVHNVNIK